MTRTRRRPAPKARGVEVARMEVPLTDPGAVANCLLQYMPAATLAELVVVLEEALADRVIAAQTTAGRAL
jgi:hypothetical protein